MNQPFIWITAPILSHGTEVWFSAYGFAWGYRAFAISYEVVCRSLGAVDNTDEQIRLAIQLGQQTLLRAIRSRDLQPYEGQRISVLLEGTVHSAVTSHGPPTCLEFENR